MRPCALHSGPLVSECRTLPHPCGRIRPLARAGAPACTARRRQASSSAAGPRLSASVRAPQRAAGFRVPYASTSVRPHQAACARRSAGVHCAPQAGQQQRRRAAFECVRARSTACRWFQSAARFRIRAPAAGPAACARRISFHCLSLSCIVYCIWTSQYFDLLFVHCVHLDLTMRVLDDQNGLR